jgi:phosphotriesterase-related protein
MNRSNCSLGKKLINPLAFVSVLLLLFFFACQSGNKQIMTVQGFMDADSMGVTLVHEHVLVDFIGADSTGYDRWNKDTVVVKVLPFLLEAKQAGVHTMIECTPAYLGRDPVLLQMLSLQSGIIFLTNTGYYGALSNRALPSYAFEENADQLAERLINEWKNGIEFTGIRPGFIKIAIPGDSILSPLHEKLLRAAARAHLKTGLVINSHTGPAPAAFAELAVLKEEGVEPSAFIWTHAQAGNFESQVKAASMGAWISLDNVMENNIDAYVNAISNLKSKGLLNRVLISQDAGWYDVVNPGGFQFRGYTTLLTQLKPALFKAGFTADDWIQLVVKNPENAYSIDIRKKTKI